MRIFALTELSYPALFEALIPIVIEFISIQKSIVNNIGCRSRLQWHLLRILKNFRYRRIGRTQETTVPCFLPPPHLAL